MDKLKMNLQLFGEEAGAPGEGASGDEGNLDNEGEGSGAPEGEHLEPKPQPLMLTQEELDNKIRSITGKESVRAERKLMRALGMTDLKEAADFIQAGKAVAQSTGKKPSEIVQRLQNNQQAGAGQVNQNPGDDSIRRELDGIRQILTSTHEGQVKKEQEAEAKKEFGSLYEQHKLDIEDYSEERGLTLADAAAVVLRPHVKSYYETKAREEAQRKRKAPGAADGAPGTNTQDYGSLLTEEMKKICRRSNMSYKEYYESGLKTGLFKE